MSEPKPAPESQHGAETPERKMYSEIMENIRDIEREVFPVGKVRNGDFDLHCAPQCTVPASFRFLAPEKYQAIFSVSQLPPEHSLRPHAEINVPNNNTRYTNLRIATIKLIDRQGILDLGLEIPADQGEVKYPQTSWPDRSWPERWVRYTLDTEGNLLPQGSSNIRLKSEDLKSVLTSTLGYLRLTKEAALAQTHKEKEQNKNFL